jgi:hypothetical protein
MTIEGRNRDTDSALCFCGTLLVLVMPGLVPGIHALLGDGETKNVDGWDICAKTRFALLPGDDDGKWKCPKKS